MGQNRRNFIKSIGVTGATVGVGVLPNLLAKSKDSVKKKKVDELNFKVTILQTTDVHCQLHAHDELFWENNAPVFRKTGGYAHLSTYLKKIRKQNRHVFTIDTGDMFQGSELSIKTMGEAISPLLNGLKYDLYLPGNWEVIYGKKQMQKLLGGLQAPKVCANMFHNVNGQKGEHIFPPYYIWTVNGVKFGFIGYTDHLVPIRQSPNYSKGILYTKPEENIAHFVDVLKNQEGCAYIMVIAHMGLSQQIHLSNLDVCNGVDYILGGDTHERVRKPIQGKFAKVVEPGAFGSFVGRLTLTVKDGKVIKDDYDLDEISVDSYKADSKMTNLITQNESPYLKDIQKVVGYSTIPLYRYFVIENTIDTLVLDALRWKLPEIDIVFSNGFRFCPPMTTRDHTGNIPITNGYIFDMLPVDSHIRTGAVKGDVLLKWLEKELQNVFAKDASKRFGGWVIKFNGMQVNFNAFGEDGKRVQSVTIGNTPLDTEKMYTIAACERDGDPDDMICRMKQVQDVKNHAYTLHENMRQYLQSNSPVTPTIKKAAVALDVESTLLTQVHGVDYTFR
ncbi:MAG: 5'-nucleotidase C-terminal domain-containing protein [Saprospiraceae bacterium]